MFEFYKFLLKKLTEKKHLQLFRKCKKIFISFKSVKFYWKLGIYSEFLYFSHRNLSQVERMVNHWSHSKTVQDKRYTVCPFDEFTVVVTEVNSLIIVVYSKSILNKNLIGTQFENEFFFCFFDGFVLE